MRTLCPNFNNEDGLETVLEVPVPDEMFSDIGCNAAMRWKNMRAWMKKPQTSNGGENTGSNSNDHFMLLLKLVGSPLIPLHVQTCNTLTTPINNGCIEASTAKYIVQQYLAAMGGLTALNSVNSMYAIGQLKMVSSDIQQANGDDTLDTKRGTNVELGGFVLWQKNPDFWFLELVVSGCKISAGCDGKVAWSQSSTHPSQASKGPPKPLRRLFQGLDPRSTASLFLSAVCIGEKSINNEECFILKLEISPDILSIQSTPNTEIVHHRIWGCFSQRTGLLIQFEDTKLVRMKNTSSSSSAAATNDENIYWETNIESTLEDYRCIDGINIAHGGRTSATIYRYGRSLNHRAKIDETWRIEEVDFNITGLSLDCFLPPADLFKSEILVEDDEPAIII
ncbi:uncharacterized protein LOC124925340 [Impatiens glandulifera]|uniref:uncharacterized protein LOC124925340 n=1 Tax=Impatiens glandulifera TaxID=253017 RepID=UPI001FB145F5|nr:uncharacterized protein LOC124925340 [Impatiens glandulifera]